MSATQHVTLTLDGRSATLTLESTPDGVWARLSSPDCFLDGEAPGYYLLVPQRQGPDHARIAYCTWCQQPRPSDIPHAAPCPLCGGEP